MSRGTSKTYVANLSAHGSIRKRFTVQATSEREVVAQVLRLAQDLSAADFRDVQGATTADAILDHGYDGAISIDNTSLRRGQRRVVLSIGNRSSHGLRLDVKILLPETLLEELVQTVRENALNALTVLDLGGQCKPT
jgi:hypothetical protein